VGVLEKLEMEWAGCGLCDRRSGPIASVPVDVIAVGC